MIYSALRDSLMLRRIEIRSVRLMRQLQAIIEDNGYIGAGADSAEGDDLVSALVLAHWSWVEYTRPRLVARNMTWQSVHEKPPSDTGSLLSYAFSSFFQDLNARQRAHRERF